MAPPFVLYCFPMINQTVLIATNNQHKVREFREIFADIAPAIKLAAPRDLGISLDIEETGRTYAANARRKALAFARAARMLVLADDSGLEVAALAGAPGVYSARYAGDGASSDDRIALLLRNLSSIPPEQRSARFVAVIAVADSNGTVRSCRGSVRGFIINEKRGQGGFGYDPVFYMPEFGCTMAELPAAIKNKVSHRARAAQRALPLLESLGAY